MAEEITALVKVKPQTDEAVIALHGQALKLQNYAESLTITNDSDIKNATNDLSIMSRLKKTIEEKRREYLNPIQGHIFDINEAFKSFTEPLISADQTTRKKIIDYRTAQEAIRQEQERINQMRIVAAQAEMELKGELTESVNLVEVSPEVPNQYRAEMGMVSQRDNWKYEVIDFALLPDDYKVPDTTMLTSIAKKHHDQKQISGIRFYNEPIIAVRSNTK